MAEDHNVQKQMMTDDLMLAVFVAVEGAHAFSAFMPSTFTTLKYGANPGDRQKLRMGFIPAVLFNLILGGTVSYFAGSKKPLVASILVTGTMVGFYEWNIHMGTSEGHNSVSGDVAAVAAPSNPSMGAYSEAESNNPKGRGIYAIMDEYSTMADRGNVGGNAVI